MRLDIMPIKFQAKKEEAEFAQKFSASFYLRFSALKEGAAK